VIKTGANARRILCVAMPTTWESSGGVKIKRAKEHIRNLEASIGAFVKRSPYDILPCIDNETGQIVVSVLVREFPSIRWGAVVGDAVHNLSSALNILWRMVWPVTVRGENRRDDFPIYKSADVFEARFRGEQKGAREPVVDLLKTLKPYKGGNDLLWMLRVIDNADKHHLLIPVFVNFGGGTATLTADGKRPASSQIPFQQPVYAINNNTELFRIDQPPGFGADVYVEAEVTLEEAFAEPEIVKGQPIVSTLHQLAGEVDRVVELFLGADLVS